MPHLPDKTKKAIKIKKSRRRNIDVPLEDFYDEFDFERELFETLKQARIEAGLSQSILARRIGVKQSAIARFESGKTNPTLTFLKKIILALDLKIAISKT